MALGNRAGKRPAIDVLAVLGTSMFLALFSVQAVKAFPGESVFRKPVEQAVSLDAALDKRGAMNESGRQVNPHLIKKRLRGKNYNNIDITGTAGPFIEVEACQKSTHYYMQMNKNGRILQRTKMGECGPDTPSLAEENRQEANELPLNLVAVNNPQLKKKRNRRQTAVIMPTDNPGHKKRRAYSRKELLKKQGYTHIYAPQKRGLGIMACKNGREYAFDVMGTRLTSWNDMLLHRKEYGKCFGYGKQILNKRQLVYIMQRHGDTNIKVVRGRLPMFEAYSCLHGKRRHVKINRWGNDNVRIIGKCR